METKYLEKEFEIEIIASIIENRLLTEEQKIYDFCSFITNEDINMYNFHIYVNKIKKLILEQHPEINRINYERDYEIENHTINALKTIYKTTYGKTIKIKSLKKVAIKVLKMQD